MAKVEINKEDLDNLVDLFQTIRVEGISHDISSEYAAFTKLLKSKYVQEHYDIEGFKNTLNYFKQHGLSLAPDTKLFVFLPHAYKHPEVAMQPYNTIDLRTSPKVSKFQDKSKAIIQPASREAYDKTLGENKKTLIEQMEEHAKNGTKLDTGFLDPELPSAEEHNGVGCSKCLNGYITMPDGRMTFCECYKRDLFITKMRKAGIPKDYFSISKIDSSLIDTCGKKMFGQDMSKIRGVDLNLTINNYTQNLKKIKEEGWNLILEGPTGSAKTTSACICLKEAIKQGYTTQFVEVQKLRRLWTGEQKTQELEDLKSKIVTVDFLVLDDLGQEFISSTSDHQLSEMDYLLRERISECKCTIITTNSSQEDIRKRYQERIFSLLQRRNIHLIISTKNDLRNSEDIPDFI